MAKGQRAYYAGVIELEGECGMAGEADKQRGQRYHLTQAQLRKLTPHEHPAIDPETGRTRLVAHTGEPYRILLALERDTTPGVRGLAGFGVRIGKTKNTYEVQVGTGVGTQTKRVTLGSVLELTMDEAMRKALDARQSIQATGDSPKRAEKNHEDALAARTITVRTCLGLYITHLTSLMVNGKRKPSSVQAVRDSLARIERPEVNLANKQLRDLTPKITDPADMPHPMITAWNACRLSCMKLSNQLDEKQREVLEAAGKWWELSAVELEALGFRGRHIQRAKAAGLAATEHTFGDIHRAIQMAMAEEKEKSNLQKRDSEITVDPTRILYKEGYFRDHTALRAHYRKAQVRNPLGEAEEDQSLQRALKALVQRRDHFTDVHQKVGVDYLLIVLLWGLRRNEGTVLRWYDDCTPGELSQQEASWVWLAPHTEAVNATTHKRGSQAFLHDTKTGVIQYIPIPYFAERILRLRWDDRLDTIQSFDYRLRKAKLELLAAEKRTQDEIKLALYRKAIRREEYRRRNAGWVFPARSVKAKAGYYKDSKSLLLNLRKETGRLDLAKDIDQGLTVHDFRRTFGRIASKHLSGRMVSELLKHFRSSGLDGDDKSSSTTEQFYTDQEWGDVRAAMATVEEAIIRSSPRVWNRLKGPDKPVLDEVNDPPVQLAWTRRKTGGEEE
ncbi:MAG: integrase [Rubrivivax sp.]|jgi:hypothetical protein|nr:MAG: integrase [Rubrivivax sp.]